jgi:hypothetical protein
MSEDTQGETEQIVSQIARNVDCLKSRRDIETFSGDFVRMTYSQESIGVTGKFWLTRLIELKMKHVS